MTEEKTVYGKELLMDQYNVDFNFELIFDTLYMLSIWKIDDIKLGLYLVIDTDIRKIELCSIGGMSIETSISRPELREYRFSTLECMKYRMWMNGDNVINSCPCKDCTFINLCDPED